MRATRKVAPGFTLVELLVVIGIIAILIAILLPTIAAANRTAKTTACLSNIRSIGQALSIYKAEYKGSYPYAYYIANNQPSSAVTAAAGDGGESITDSQTYVWWSVLRGVMRGKGANMDNSIVLENGSKTTRYMQAFNCPAGLNRDAGCDFSANAAVMIIKDDEERLSTGHAKNRALAKPATDKSVPPDCAIIWDTPELGNVDPLYSRQYVASYYVDTEHFQGQDTMLSTPKKPANRYRGLADPNDPSRGDGFVIDPGINEEVTSATVSKLAGNIRWRHGRNDQANFLFADGSAKTFAISKKVSGNGPSSIYRGEVTRKMLRPKLPAGYSGNPG